MEVRLALGRKNRLFDFSFLKRTERCAVHILHRLFDAFESMQAVQCIRQGRLFKEIAKLISLNNISLTSILQDSTPITSIHHTH